MTYFMIVLTAGPTRFVGWWPNLNLRLAPFSQLFCTNEPVLIDCDFDFDPERQDGSESMPQTTVLLCFLG